MAPSRHNPAATPDTGASPNHQRENISHGAGLVETRKLLFDWIRNKERCVVIGEPGTGKSALLRYIALSVLN